jgi:hypothetical protein
VTTVVSGLVQVSMVAKEKVNLQYNLMNLVVEKKTMHQVTDSLDLEDAGARVPATAWWIPRECRPELQWYSLLRA